MPSETDTIIKEIQPRLDGLGWDVKNLIHNPSKEDLGGKKTVYPDAIYKHKGRIIVVFEFKKLGKGKSRKRTPDSVIDTEYETPIEQATRAASVLKSPIAIATDGGNYLETFHLKSKKPLFNYDGEEFSQNDWRLLTLDNVVRLVQKPSLKSRIKTDEEFRKIFKDMNKYARACGWATGVERVQETAKIIFIKMLSDNDKYIDSTQWKEIVESPPSRVVNKINHLFRDEIKGINIPKLMVDDSKSEVICKIIRTLDEIDFNKQHYKAHSTLFQEFLSARSQGQTNDLGQYFTPTNVVRLLFWLADIDKSHTIYDPFCGTGGILCHTFTAIAPDTTNSNRSHIAGGSGYAKNHLFGSEITVPVATLAKMNMVIAGDGHSNIVPVDSLSAENSYMQKKTRFDRVVTNIPFDPHVPNDVSSGYFKIAHDSSAQAKYIEHCINRCKPGGRIVLISGLGVLTENSLSSFRRRLLENYDLESIIPLYSGVFEYAGARGCILVINKQKPAGKFIMFHDIRREEDVNTLINSQTAQTKILRADLLKHPECNFSLTTSATPATAKQCKFSDLANLIDRNTLKHNLNDATNICKVTTPNSIDGGMYLIESKAPKIKGGDDKNRAGTYKYYIHKESVVIANIPNRRKNQPNPYLGSAWSRDDEGIITQEYFQFLVDSEKHGYFLLYYLRTPQGQKIAQRTQGTGGQQRVGIENLLNMDVPVPNKRSMNLAYDKLMRIEDLRCDMVKKGLKGKDLLKEYIQSKDWQEFRY